MYANPYAGRILAGKYDSGDGDTAMPQYAAEMIDKEADHCKLYDGVGYTRPLAPATDDPSLRLWRIELHKLFLAHDNNYKTLWERYKSTWTGGDGDLYQRLEEWAAWARECERLCDACIQIEGCTVAFCVAVCESLTSVVLYPFDRMTKKGVEFTATKKDTKKVCNSIIMARRLTGTDVGLLDDASRLHHFKPIINPAAALAGPEPEDPYPTVWVGQVRSFYQVIRPGHRALPPADQEYMELADASWLIWPKKMEDRHCPVLGVPIVRAKSQSDMHFSKRDLCRLVVCGDIMPANITLAPCKYRTESGEVKIAKNNDGTPKKWHVLHRHSDFFMQKV